jgi:pyrroloquinoline-quinone synthase
MARDVIATLNEMIAERNLLKHPFYQAWTAGALSIERLRNYAVNYYPHVAAFPRYLSTIHSRCADIAIRQALLENLIEEERGAENHPELWLRFAEALGLNRSRVLEAQVSPAVLSLVHTFTELCTSERPAAGLSAIYAYEVQIPAVACAKIEGLRQFYGITDDRAVGFCSVHQKADVEHSQTAAHLIARQCAGDAESFTGAIDSGRRALDALWSALDSM